MEDTPSQALTGQMGRQLLYSDLVLGEGGTTQKPSLLLLWGRGAEVTGLPPHILSPGLGVQVQSQGTGDQVCGGRECGSQIAELSPG